MLILGTAIDSVVDPTSDLCHIDVTSPYLLASARIYDRGFVREFSADGWAPLARYNPSDVLIRFPQPNDVLVLECFEEQIGAGSQIFWSPISHFEVAWHNIFATKEPNHQKALQRLLKLYIQRGRGQAVRARQIAAQANELLKLGCNYRIRMALQLQFDCHEHSFQICDLISPRLEIPTLAPS